LAKRTIVFAERARERATRLALPFIDLGLDLEELFGRHVDLVTWKAVKDAGYDIETARPLRRVAAE